jgi:hypothetical protein
MPARAALDTLVITTTMTGEGPIVPLPDPIRRRSLAAAAALLASAAAVRGSLAQIRPEEGRVAIAVGARSTVSYLPLTIAAQLGYFRAEGLDVTLIDLPDEAGALQALGAGAADVASCTYEHTIRLQARGPALQSFVLQGRTPQIAVGISTRTMSGYRSVADLRGRRIGVSASESATQTVLGILLRRGGLTPADVSLVSVGMGAGALNALRSGQIDAISNVEPVMTHAGASGGRADPCRYALACWCTGYPGRPNARGLPLCIDRVRAEASRHLPGPGPCDRPGVEMAAHSRPWRHRSDRARGIPVGRPRPVPPVTGQGDRGVLAGRPDAAGTGPAPRCACCRTATFRFEPTGSISGRPTPTPSPAWPRIVSRPERRSVRRSGAGTRTQRRQRFAFAAGLAAALVDGLLVRGRAFGRTGACAPQQPVPQCGPARGVPLNARAGTARPTVPFAGRPPQAPGSTPPGWQR